MQIIRSGILMKRLALIPNTAVRLIFAVYLYVCVSCAYSIRDFDQLNAYPGNSRIFARESLQTGTLDDKVETFALDESWSTCSSTTLQLEPTFIVLFNVSADIFVTYVEIRLGPASLASSASVHVVLFNSFSAPVTNRQFMLSPTISFIANVYASSIRIRLWGKEQSKLEICELRFVQGPPSLVPANLRRQSWASQFGEDEFAAALWFLNRPPLVNATVVEVGAGDGLRASISVYFESVLGWRAICIEPSSQYQRLVENRPNAKNVHGAVCAERRMVSFSEHVIEPLLSHVSTSAVPSDQFAAQYAVMCEPLSNYISGVRHVDFLSLDCEGCELDAVQSLVTANITVSHAAVETYGKSDDEMRKLLSSLRMLNLHYLDTLGATSLFA
mmetsp:Transcript_38372/g.62188  ORF Transcript_38372/g.62188 Transcript_38372/m.62188 type:complete len:387 (-) Transcript_38372:174-1334(-)